jgi:hypothetical protein
LFGEKPPYALGWIKKGSKSQKGARLQDMELFKGFWKDSPLYGVAGGGRGSTIEGI